MKTRIALTLALLLGLPLLNKALIEPTQTIVKNQAAVATVNGGDAAFVTQQAINSGFSLTTILLFLGALVVLFFIWASTVKKIFSEDSANSKI